VVEQFYGVFIKFLAKTTQGIPNQHSGEEQDDVETGGCHLDCPGEGLVCRQNPQNSSHVVVLS
jgi:hypothetical protein